MEKLYTGSYKTLLKELNDKQMGRQPVLMDWKTSYCQMSTQPQSNLQIHCYPIKIPRALFAETKKPHPNINMESLRTLKITKIIFCLFFQNNFDNKEKHKGLSHCFQNILQSYHNPNNMSLPSR